MLSKEEIRAQSEAAYKQWAPQWREHAKINSKFPQQSFTDFENIGIGKAVLCVAMGQSMEKEINVIKAYQGNVDIICCDKALGILLDHDIIPTYCLVCDANVSYEKYMHPWKDKLSDIILISNICANPKWIANGNWKNKYFFVVKDVLQSEKEFCAISGCPETNVVPAGTNVSNSLVILLTQSDNEGRRNYFGYDKILLIGFDYSWPLNGHYYAFDPDGGGKHNYMRHGYMYDGKGTMVCSSNNLIFSGRWLTDYVNAFALPVVQCTKETVLVLNSSGNLSEQMQYSYKPEDADRVRDKIKLKRILDRQLKSITKEVEELAWDHNNAYLSSVS